MPLPNPFKTITDTIKDFTTPIGAGDTPGFWERRKRRHDAQVLVKGLNSRFDTISEKAEQAPAAEQASKVNLSMEVFGMYGDENNIRQKTGMTMSMLRSMAANCEPIAAIIGTRQKQAIKYARHPHIALGQIREPGFRIKMRVPSQEATVADEAQIQKLSNYILDCGFRDPPENEKSLNWQPGFEAFISQIVRDVLTYDYVAVRRWSASKDEDRLNEVPVTAWEAVDASLVRRVDRVFVRLDDGQIVTKDWEGQRTNTSREIKYVMLSEEGGTDWTDEFTADEMVTGVGHATTDTSRNGMGYGPLEQLMNAVYIWISGRNYNSSRFSADKIPRGFLAINGDFQDESQFDTFKLQWTQMMTGQKSRWGNPVIRSSSTTGSAVNWIPIDMSPREMEYTQFMHTVAGWMHAVYAISMAETGYDMTSPNAPPLSEASPEAKITHSQSSGFEPMMRWIANFINREILWKIDKERRYMFEWVGLNDTDPTDEANYYNLLMTSGQATPRMVWKARDQQITEEMDKSPAMDLPMPFETGVMLLMQMDQAAEAKKQAKMQMQQAQAQGDPSQGQPGQPGAPGMPPGAGGGGQPGGDEQQMQAQLQQMQAGQAQRSDSNDRQEAEPPGGSAQAMQKSLADWWI